MSSLPKVLEGLTDVGAQLGDLKFVMSKVAPERKAVQAELTDQERVRRAFVLQASLAYDANEIKVVLEQRIDRLPIHLKTITERSVPWMDDLKAALPNLVRVIKEADPALGLEFDSANVVVYFEKECALVSQLLKELQLVLEGGQVQASTAVLCDEIVVIAKSLFPLFARAKDAVGVLKAHGAI